MKELFKDDGRLNKEGQEMQRYIDSLLEPWFEEQIKAGYRHQDIEVLISRVGQTLTLKSILGF